MGVLRHRFFPGDIIPAACSMMFPGNKCTIHPTWQWILVGNYEPWVCIYIYTYIFKINWIYQTKTNLKIHTYTYIINIHIHIIHIYKCAPPNTSAPRILLPTSHRQRKETHHLRALGNLDDGRHEFTQKTFATKKSRKPMPRSWWNNEGYTLQ